MLKNKDQTEERERQMERQFENSVHGQALGRPGGDLWDDEGELQAQYLESLTKTSLSEGTTDLLQNMLSRDFVLGYLSKAENVELKWLVRILKIKVFDAHPPEESVHTGRYRAFLYEDENDTLEPLNDRERMIIDQFIKGVLVRASRSRKGWQQQKLSESVQVSEIRDNKDSGSGGGLMGMLRS